MRKIKVLIILALLAVIFAGCSEKQKYYAGEKISQDEITRYSEEIFAEKEKVDPITATDTYYWTPDGIKYHIFRDCSTLAKSNTVLSGTLEDGMLAGKSGLCKTCEKRFDF
ncbi:MAG: hypothetical protein J5894_03000 [Clostridia bacterium]|nr:hypothetical protein [Clostridia bacterium]